MSGQKWGLRTQATAFSDLLTPTLILHTKFALPHLLASLEQGVRRPLTLVSARPDGYIGLTGGNTAQELITNYLYNVTGR